MSLTDNIKQVVKDQEDARSQAQAGVYAIRNKLNGKMYIDSTYRGFEVAYGEHVAELKAGRHQSKHLLAAWKKYGSNVFEMAVLETCDPKDIIARRRECVRIHCSDDGKFGYNVPEGRR